LEPVDKRPATVGPVHDHRDPALLRQRQEPRLGLAVEYIVGQLHGIYRMLAHDPLQRVMAAPMRGGDADMAKPPLVLHREKMLEMPFPCAQVVHLQEVELRHAPFLRAPGDLFRSLTRRGCPDLLGGEYSRAILQPFEPGTCSDKPSHLSRRRYPLVTTLCSLARLGSQYSVREGS